MRRLSLLSFFLSSCTFFIEGITPPEPRHLNPVGLASGDIDGDGDIDIVTISFDGRFLHMSILRQRGPSDLPAEIVSFELPSFFEAPRLVSANTHLADLDGDGDLDLITPTATTTVGTFINSGAGVFSVGDSLSTSRVDVVLVGDLDGDALPEVIVGEKGASGLVQVFQNEGGTLGPSQVVFDGSLNSLLLADFDGDALGDLVLVNESPRVTLISTDGAGGLLQRDLLVSGFAGFSSLQEGFDPIVAGDLNGDQVADIAAVFGPSPLLASLVNGGGDDFALSSLFSVEGSLHRRLMTADLDGDQDLDIILGTVGIEMQILLNGGDANFSQQARLQGRDTLPLAAVDIDGDQDLDIICVTLDNREQTNVFVLLNNNNTFTSRLSLTSGDLFE